MWTSINEKHKAWNTPNKNLAGQFIVIPNLHFMAYPIHGSTIWSFIYNYIKTTQAKIMNVIEWTMETRWQGWCMMQAGVVYVWSGKEPNLDWSNLPLCFVLFIFVHQPIKDATVIPKEAVTQTDKVYWKSTSWTIISPFTWTHHLLWNREDEEWKTKTLWIPLWVTSWDPDLYQKWIE